MKKYIFNYETIITFDAPVTEHSFLLRCQPMNAHYQAVEEEHLIFSPDFWTRNTTDAFGNRVLFGGMRDPHKSFAYVSAGIVSMEPYNVKVAHEFRPVYLLPTPLTRLPEEVKVERTDDVTADALAICRRVHDSLEYTPSVTSVDTTAAQVLELGKGVCQDYAHLMIALCRRGGIPARYVCGFVEGTGETHAWVEVFDGYSWIGVDPTRDLLIDYGYVKLAQGRDAADCPVSRGLYQGVTNQVQEVHVTLKQL